MYNFDTLYRRTGQKSAKWALLEKQEDLRSDETLFPFSVADMDFQTAPEIKEALLRQVEVGLFGYHELDDCYYGSFIRWMKKQHGTQVEKDWIVQTSGVVFSLYQIIAAFSQPGDGVLVQPPVYKPFYDAIEKQARQIVRNPLQLIKGQYSIDFSDFERKAADPRTKLFLLCSPHNPGGRVWTKEELVAMAEICIRHQVLIVADEIHHDLVYTPHQHTVITEAGTADLRDAIRANSIICTSPGKTFNLAGLEIANLIIPNQTIRLKLQKQLAQLGAGRANMLATTACQAAYASGGPWHQALMAYLAENRRLIEQCLRQSLPAADYSSPQGTYLAWVDMRSLSLDQRQLNLFMQKQAKLYASPGAWFGSEGAGFQRLNFALPRRALTAGLARLQQALEDSARNE